MFAHDSRAVPNIFRPYGAPNCFARPTPTARAVGYCSAAAPGGCMLPSFLPPAFHSPTKNLKSKT
jgi:hypothetical protein